MEEDVMSALRSRAVYLPGCFDRDGRVLVVVSIPSDLQPWNRKCVEICINYIRNSLSSKILKAGLSVILDAQKYSSRVTRSQCRSILALFEDNIAQILLVRPEGFWDKHVEHCAKTQTTGEPIVVTKTRLIKYFEIAELPVELGGTFVYNHDRWLQNRFRIKEFRTKYDKTLNDLDNLHISLLDHKSMRPSDASQALSSCERLYTDVQSAVNRIIEMGNQLTANISDCYRLPPPLSSAAGAVGSINCSKMPQDIAGEQEKIADLLNEIEKKQSGIRSAWNELEKSIHDARELSTLEEGVGTVTNWILGTAELMLNRQQRVGCDVPSCDELRRENEHLEMQCWETYGFYAELLYKIDSYPFNKDSFAYKDLMSQRDFMDFVCRSFATRLERRRNMLITSVRFFRLVSEYFDKTSDVFESLVMGNKIDDLERAATNLQKLKDSQTSLDNVEKELVKEGEKLSDMLSMPVKDALGRDIGVDYSDDIANVRDILDATIARRNIFIDSVELQKLTLEQVAHIHEYEKDARTAIKWMDDLYHVMIRCHSHVGCNVHEIQVQKGELQTFQETGKGIYNYGCQLLEASLALRQSCKLDIEMNSSLSAKLRQTWANLQTVSQENMTRLRVSAVFHRSVEEYCNKLYDLKTNVMTMGEIDEPERRRVRLRKYLTLRERLLVEVGRMVRLGRLLKTRLKEPFVLEDSCINGSLTPNSGAPSPSTSTSAESSATVLPIGNNSIACSAISSKLTDVADIAESLDSVLQDTQNGLDLLETNSSSSEKKCEHNPASSTDDWSSSIRSTEDESYITASDFNGTLQSRSSSYHTASESRTSPWWSLDKSSIEDYSEISTETPPTPRIAGILSSANVSFDSCEDQSFRTDQQSPEVVNSVSGKSDTTVIDQDKVPGQSGDDENSVYSENDASKSNDDSGCGTAEGPVPEVRASKAASWSANYYQNINISKQAIKGCL